jgi:hypothetical protein
LRWRECVFYCYVYVVVSDVKVFVGFRGLRVNYDMSGSITKSMRYNKDGDITIARSLIVALYVIL